MSNSRFVKNSNWEFSSRLVEELDRLKTNSSYDPLAMLKGQNKPETKQATPLNKSRQTLLLSATLTKGIAELADFTMTNHVYIDALDESEAVNPDHMVIPNTVKQEFLLTFIKHRLVMLSAFLISKAKQNCKTIVFMATSQMVDFHHELFSKCLLKMPINKGKLKQGHVLLLDEVELDDSDDEEVVLDVELFRLHGNMSQQERKTVFSGFRTAKKGILICTVSFLIYFKHFVRFCIYICLAAGDCYLICVVNKTLRYEILMISAVKLERYLTI